MSRILAVLAVAVWAMLLSPYPTTIFIAAVTASLTLPIYRWLCARMRKIAAICCFAGGLLFCVSAPIAIVAVMVVPQALEGARRISIWWQDGHPIPPAIAHYLSEAYRLFVEYVPNSAEYLDKIRDDFTAVVNSVIKSAVSGSLNLAGDTMGLLISLLMLIVFVCLIVVYASSIRSAILQIIPGHGDMVDRFISVIHNASRAVFIGIVFVPVIQGTLTGIGLRILDVPDPAFWGLLAVFTAVIPMAGTALVWLPIAVYLWAAQSLTSALLLVAWGGIVVSGSDNLLRPYFLKTGIEASMIVLLLSILCSLSVFGAVGLIAGPVLVAVATQAMKESRILAQRHSGSI